MARRDPRILVGVHRFVAGWHIFQLAVWAVFLLVFPAMCLLHGLAGAAVLLGSLGLLLDVKALDLLLAWTRGWAAPLRKLALLYHGSVALAGVVLIAQPIDRGWLRVAGTEDRGDLTVAYRRDGLVIGSGGGSALNLHAHDGSVRPLDYRGGPSWILQPGPEDSLWLAPPNTPLLHVLDRDGAWSQIPRPAGYPRALAPGRDRVWLVADAFHVLDRATNRWSLVDACGWPTGVALAPDESELLVVGGDGCWRSSRDGRQWTDVAPLDAADLGRFPEAAVGAGGWSYVFTSGFWSSTIHARGPDDPRFLPRPSPARDIRVLLAEPHEPGRVWVGTWGEGVYYSHDAGETWMRLGLRRIQIRSLAVDFTRYHVAAGGSNLLFDRGAYVYEMPP